jgi:hypothetical protein
MAAKVRIGNPTVSEINRDWLIAEAERTRRTVPDALDMILNYARTRGLDLTSGQARELAEAMNSGGKA